MTSHIDEVFSGRSLSIVPVALAGPAMNRHGVFWEANSDLKFQEFRCASWLCFRAIANSTEICGLQVEELGDVACCRPVDRTDGHADARCLPDIGRVGGNRRRREHSMLMLGKTWDIVRRVIPAGLV